MYALSETSVKGFVHSVIEVFDLGLFGDEFKHQTTIEMYELVDQIDIWYNRKREPTITKNEWASFFKIVDI
jgi:hypothetical protein